VLECAVQDIDKKEEKRMKGKERENKENGRRMMGRIRERK
jgi:hypothetical protein